MSGGQLQGRRSGGPRQSLHAVEAAAGTQSVTIYTTCGWKATGDDWITIEPLSGGEKGIFAVHLSFGANDTGALRTGRVVFEAGTYSETYTLTQKAQ